MTKAKEISFVKIKSTRRNPDSVTLQDREVHIQGTDLKKCERIAREIWKKELKA